MTIADRVDDSSPSLEGLPAQGMLVGGGEMGGLMRARDWASTALGPVGGWPQSLRTSVSICLSSRFPIILFWGSDLVQIYNDAYRPMLGGKHPAALGQRCRETWPEIWQIVAPMLEGVLLRGEATWSENQHLVLERHGFVEDCHFTFSYSPIRDESAGIGGVFCVVSETTRQVLGERRLRTLRDLAAGITTAKREEETWQIVADALRSNPYDLPFTRLYRAGATTGEPSHLVAATGVAPERWSEHADAAADARATAAGGEGPSVRDGAMVLSVSRPGGEPFGFLVAGISARHPLDDDYRGFLAMVADQIAAGVATARAHDEERRRAAALAELDRAKSALFSNVSHEFRTPLTLMLAPIEDALADTEAPLPRAQRERMEMVRRNGLRLQKLVNTLLEFARAEAGRAQAVFVPTDLAALTTDLAASFRAAIERAGLALMVETAALPVTVPVDRSMWEKIVLNLLSNALKFTFEGTIVVGLRARGDHVELTVTDSGVGIPEHEIARVFERFHRVEGTRARTHEGSGIGLALVRDLVRLHGGQVEVTSAVGRGTTFTVSIPTGGGHLHAAQASSEATSPRDGSRAERFVTEALGWLPESSHPELLFGAETTGASATAARILVAEDNADMRAYVTRLLRQHWTVVAVADGKQALEAARRDLPDLVVTDVMMPGMAGLELVRELRADRRTRAIPILALSARAGEETTVEGLRVGADDYLIKPFSASALVVRVESQLASARVRAQASAAVEQERQRLYSLFMDGPAAICTLRGDALVIELANSGVLDAWGKTDAILGKPLLEAVPELVGQGFDTLLREVMRSGSPHHARAALARLDKNRDGSPLDLYFDFAFSPLRDGEGDITGALIFAFDVTEQVSARRTAEAARAEAEQARGEAEAASRTKDEFLAMLGHELRNPLAPILTALDLMRVHAPASDELARVVIERQVGHLVRLVDDLLDVARITRGEVELRRQVVEMAAVVAKAIEMASPLLEQFEQNLTVDVASAGLAVDGDVSRLAQVVSNLLTNAAKYTERGGAIAIHAAREGAQVVLRVSDTGVGIAPEMLPLVFDMFAQERQSLARSRGGLGLGLAIVRNLVTAHGGTVSVHSEGRGCGSVFTVTFPAARSVLPGVAEATPAPAPSITSGGLSILVVDDNEDAATMLALSLRRMGHVVRVAHDGPSGLRAAAELVPDVALLDIGLPVMDGYDLARRLRSEHGRERLRLVAVTGYGQAQDLDRSREAGFDLHLVKPVDRARLRAALDQFAAERAQAGGAAPTAP